MNTYLLEIEVQVLFEGVVVELLKTLLELANVGILTVRTKLFLSFGETYFLDMVS